MVGIYKITSPSGAVYIGQSWNIERRWKDYRYHKKSKNKLNSSFIKHGFVNHNFEVVHELPNDVTQDILDEYECIYLNQYTDLGFTMLNLRDGGNGGQMSKESKDKMRASKTGTKRGPMSEEQKIKISNTIKSQYETRPAEKEKLRVERMNAARVGRKLSPEHRKKISERFKNRQFSPDHRKKLSLAGKKRYNK